MQETSERTALEAEQWHEPEEQAPKEQALEEQASEEQEALASIPWEDEIAEAFGVTGDSIPEPMPSFEVEETPVKKRPKLALIIAGVLPLVGFGVLWGGISFVQALGAIVEESKQAKQPTGAPDDPWQLEVARLRKRLNQKDRRTEIEVFNEQVKQSKTKPTAKTPSAPTTPPQSSRPPTPRRIAAPRVVYRQAPPPPKPAPRPISRPIPPAPKPISKPSPAPRAVSKPAPRPQPRVFSPPKPQLSALEQWDKLASLNTMGSNGGSQNLDFEIDETGTYEYDTPAPSTPSRFPVGLTAEAKLLDSLSFKGIASLPASLELLSPLGEIPTGAKLSAMATVSDGVVTFQIQGYDNLFGYEAISDAQIMASVPAQLKGGGNRNGLLGDILSIGSEVLKEETGQSIDFDSNGRIASVETATNNNWLDRAIGTGADVMSQRLQQSSSRGEKYFKVKKGETVTLSVLGE